MKILVVSDSHGLSEELTQVARRHEDDVQMMIHCGDSELPAHAEAMQGFNSVRGNCDLDSAYPDHLVEKCGQQHLFVTHGHLYNVKMTLMNLLYRAKEVDAKVVCFGHSHIAGTEMADGILFINPGSLRLPRMRKDKTYVILHIQNRHIHVNYYSIEGKIIPSLSSEFILE
ncbi:metallophosphoesterase [Bacillus sp. SM2101]|uniref:metallophosphoesterase family protein n=1 Tax=Bacillus sp. SM2101 TaxID=2805366 RepID=UPI001BDF47AB|nr:metallophosphoesterase [Bacillus sp. SM2101]